MFLLLSDSILIFSV